MTDPARPLRDLTPVPALRLLPGGAPHFEEIKPETKKQRKERETAEAVEAERLKMERVCAQLAEARRVGWLPFSDPLEDEYERFISTRVRGFASGPTPDEAFWMAEPDGDLPLDTPLPWETRPDA